MNPNVGQRDRQIRIVVGLILVVTAVSATMLLNVTNLAIYTLSLLGPLLLATAIIGFCPINWVAGVNTGAQKKQYALRFDPAEAALIDKKLGRNIFIVMVLVVVGVGLVTMIIGIQITKVTLDQMTSAYALPVTDQIQRSVKSCFAAAPGTPFNDRQVAELDKRLSYLINSPNVVDIRIWNADGTRVVYSADPKMRGARLKADRQVTSALQTGKTKYSITRYLRESSRQANAPLKTYVPLLIDGKIRGVYEVHFSREPLKPLFEFCTKFQLTAGFFITIGIVIVGLVSLGLIRTAPPVSAITGTFIVIWNRSLGVAGVTTIL
jgi:hypothetical protein